VNAEAVAITTFIMLAVGGVGWLVRGFFFEHPITQHHTRGEDLAKGFVWILFAAMTAVMIWGDL